MKFIQQETHCFTLIVDSSALWSIFDYLSTKLLTVWKNFRLELNFLFSFSRFGSLFYRVFLVKQYGWVVSLGWDSACDFLIFRLCFGVGTGFDFIIYTWLFNKLRLIDLFLNFRDILWSYLSIGSIKVLILWRIERITFILRRMWIVALFTWFLRTFRFLG